MNTSQWRALCAFCRDNACTKHELLEELKANGTVEEHASLDDLSNYTPDNTYEGMKQFLEDNI